LRSLAADALTLSRPSADTAAATDVAAATETITFNRGIPVRAEEKIDGRTLSVTEFSRGRPVSQKIDIDLDGRFETIRKYDTMITDDYYPIAQIRAASQSGDFDGDGVFEYKEEYENDGTTRKFWDYGLGYKAP
jgi:hypothetical protein